MWYFYVKQNLSWSFRQELRISVYVLICIVIAIELSVEYSELNALFHVLVEYSNLKLLHFYYWSTISSKMNHSINRIEHYGYEIATILRMIRDESSNWDWELIKKAIIIRRLWTNLNLIYNEIGKKTIWIKLAWI